MACPEGNIHITTDNDDFSDDASEGCPLVRGISQSATRTPGDTAVWFHIDLTTAMTNLNAHVSGAPIVSWADGAMFSDVSG